jgi:hypothetical protein
LVDRRTLEGHAIFQQKFMTFGEHSSQTMALDPLIMIDSALYALGIVSEQLLHRGHDTIHSGLQECNTSPPNPFTDDSGFTTHFTIEHYDSSEYSN